MCGHHPCHQSYGKMFVHEAFAQDMHKNSSFGLHSSFSPPSLFFHSKVLIITKFTTENAIWLLHMCGGYVWMVDKT